jgi:hypothetical protein
MADEPNPSPAPAPAPAAWHASVADEPLRTAVSKFDSIDKAVAALGYKAPVAPAPADWRAGITDPELKTQAERFTSPLDAVKSVVDLRKRESTAIRIPGEGAKPEEVAAYRKQIGVPETPEGYKFPDLAAGETLTDEMKASRALWAKRFHDRNVPAAVASALIDELRADTEAVLAGQVEADTAYAKEQDTVLRREWGADYDKNKEFANRAISRLFADQLDAVRAIEAKTGRFILDDARFVKAFAQIGREAAEGGLLAPSDADRATIQDQIRTTRLKIEEAGAKGDRPEMNRLYAEEQRLIALQQGNAPIVGAQGRAA